MKKRFVFWLVMLMIAALLVGCDTPTNVEPNTTGQPILETEAPAAALTEAATETTAEEVTEAPTEAEAEDEEDIVYEGDASSYYIDVVYAEQIGRYYTALSEQWGEGEYYENEMSALPYYYYEGNPLDNVGFGFEDLDDDGHWELIIGAIQNAEQDPAVFEIWTLVDEQPVMLVQAGVRNHYVLQYVEEDNMWYVANEAANGAANHATYYMMLIDGKLEVMQGIIFDAAADEQNPWFMAYDLDWDVSNDDPIDEATANAILESNRNHYTALEYFPYIFYK